MDTINWLPAGDKPPSFTRLNQLWMAAESERVLALLAKAQPLDAAANARIQATAAHLVHKVRQNAAAQSGMDAFMREYNLSSREGIILMCIAEALLRIPDPLTADRLIADKIAGGQWQAHLRSGSLFVNASTLGLLLTGQLSHKPFDVDAGSFLKRLVTRIGEPMVRAAMRKAMRILGFQFVMGRTIEEGLKRAASDDPERYRVSFDMLGESAITATDAARYLSAYERAIQAIGAIAPKHIPVAARASISVKLSALHPRYEYAKRGRVLQELFAAVRHLCVCAMDAGIALTIDAEEADRLELSLELFEQLWCDPALRDWQGLGLAVQAYQKRAIAVIEHLAERAATRQPINVRLVKGAYWDSEIKKAQERGVKDYPVFTRKAHTDISYLACARQMFASARLQRQFATHNAHTIASLIEMAQGQPFELQRLHGMGEELYVHITPPDGLNIPTRVYAPVGSHEDLLPYLVRRLLENGANTSFVNRLVDNRLPISEIIQDPWSGISAEHPPTAHPNIPMPRACLGETRLNPVAPLLTDPAVLAELGVAMNAALATTIDAYPLVAGFDAWHSLHKRPVRNPANRQETVGQVSEATAAIARQALDESAAAFKEFEALPVSVRAQFLRTAADAFEANPSVWQGLLVKEAGKTLADAVAEWREAIDFLRYYAQLAQEQMQRPLTLPSTTGESNELWLRGRGIFVCISPWNFPLAIFIGQVSAALVAGNVVIAKAAEQTPLIAFKACQLLHEAGVPINALQFLPGDGATLGQVLLTDPRVAGVAFTGSNETASLIQKTLANRAGPLASFIAETGGQNVMIVDSSALPEQVVNDAVVSAFGSAGQRCSALRILCVQEEIAERVIELLIGVMQELTIGDPAHIETDIGPVIDEEALANLEAHASAMATQQRVHYRVPLASLPGVYCAPLLVEIKQIADVKREVFGPILHVLRYSANELESLLKDIEATGYGLTLGIHSRIEATTQWITKQVRVGNVYVNRNMIGAVVGVQPFGGMGLSGTGPKAGGPHYLSRFTTEQTVTVNTVAVGGNASLLTITE